MHNPYRVTNSTSKLSEYKNGVGCSDFAGSVINFSARICDKAICYELAQHNTLNADLVASGLLGLVEGSVSGLDNIIRIDQVPAPFGSTDTDGHL